MKRILVTGAGGSASSNFVDSLRRAGEPYYVVGTDVSAYHLELAEVDARYLVPGADDPGFVDELNAIVEAESIEVVHAQPDQEVLALARQADDLGARTYLPQPETIALCQDKAAATAKLRAEGLPTPQMHAVDSEDSLREGTDVVLRDHERAWVRAIRGAGARASLPVRAAEQAVAWAQYWIDMRGLEYRDFMVSQFLPGRELAFQSVWRDGELVTSQARERLEYLYGHLTPSGQTSTPSVAKTVRRADVNELAAAAIRAVDPDARGVFCVDLKEDEEGQPLITEINCGRFFTTSNFFAAAGANMPYTYVKLAYGEDVGELPQFDALEEGLYWLRMVDMGFKLVREGEWSAVRAR